MICILTIWLKSIHVCTPDFHSAPALHFELYHTLKQSKCTYRYQLIGISHGIFSSLFCCPCLDFTAQNISCPFLSKTSTAACFWITACNGIFFIVQHKWCLTVVVIIQWNESFFFKIHYNDVILITMASPNHQPRDYLLDYLFKAQIKENIKAPCHWPLWGEFTCNRWIPRTKGQ